MSTTADFDLALQQCGAAIRDGDRVGAFYAVVSASTLYAIAAREPTTTGAEQQRMLDAYRRVERRFVDEVLGGDRRRGGKVRGVAVGRSMVLSALGATVGGKARRAPDLADAVRKLTR